MKPLSSDPDPGLHSSEGMSTPNSAPEVAAIGRIDKPETDLAEHRKEMHRIAMSAYGMDRWMPEARALAYLRTAKHLRSYSVVNGVCLVPAGLLGDAAGFLELAAHMEQTGYRDLADYEEKSRQASKTEDRPGSLSRTFGASNIATAGVPEGDQRRDPTHVEGGFGGLGGPSPLDVQQLPRNR